MKVLCILTVETSSATVVPIVKVGEVYEVVNISEFEGVIYYELLQQRGFEYHSRLFAPLSDIDETEMSRNYSRVDQHLFVKH